MGRASLPRNTSFCTPVPVWTLWFTDPKEGALFDQEGLGKFDLNPVK